MHTWNRALAALAVIALAACGGGGGGGGGGPSEVAEPNNSAAQATVLALPGTATQVVGSEADEDWYRITVPAGGATIRVRTSDSNGTCNSVDTIVGVFDAAATIPPLTVQDDTPVPTCEDFQITLPQGTNYIAVAGFGQTGICSSCRIPFTYRLDISIVP